MLGSADAGAFAPLFGIYRPGVDWPDAGIAETFFGRTWTHCDFMHAAQTVRNQYIGITIIPRDDESPSWHPRAFHIAYRRKSNADGLWRPYGTIIDRAAEVILIHENGAIRRQPRAPGAGRRSAFLTWFGPEPAEFRLASLDAFSCKVSPDPDPAIAPQFDG